METLKELADSAKQIGQTDVDRSGMIRKAMDKLLPCEQLAHAALADRLRESCSGGSPELDKKYPRIDIEAALASAKTQQGIPFPVPRFAAFRITDEGEIRLSASKRHPRSGISTNTPYLLDRGYGRFVEAMGELVHREMVSAEIRIRLAWILISASMFAFGLHQWICVGPSPLNCSLAILGAASAICWFSGLSNVMSNEEGFFNDGSVAISIKMVGTIPSDVREKIQRCREEKKFSEMFIVSEAGDWTYEKQDMRFVPLTTPDPDPLVVGFFNNVFYLVDKFDLSPVENWLAAEFASAKDEPEKPDIVHSLGERDDC